MNKIAIGLALALGLFISAPAYIQAGEIHGGVHGGVNVGGHGGGFHGGVHTGGGVHVGGGVHPTPIHTPGPAVHHPNPGVGVGVNIGGGYRGGYGGYRNGYGYGGYGGGVGVGVGVGVNVGPWGARPGVFIGVPYGHNPSRYVNVWVDEVIVNYTSGYDQNGNYVQTPIYTSQRRLVTAFWDNVRGGYWYYNVNGIYTRAR